MRELVFFFFDEQKRVPALQPVSRQCVETAPNAETCLAFGVPWLYFSSFVRSADNSFDYVRRVSETINTVGNAVVPLGANVRSMFRINVIGAALRRVTTLETEFVSGVRVV